jgi:hypothetical protein
MLCGSLDGTGLLLHFCCTTQVRVVDEHPSPHPLPPEMVGPTIAFFVVMQGQSLGQPALCTPCAGGCRIGAPGRRGRAARRGPDPSGAASRSAWTPCHRQRHGGDNSLAAQAPPLAADSRLCMQPQPAPTAPLLLRARVHVRRTMRTRQRGQSLCALERASCAQDNEALSALADPRLLLLERACTRAGQRGLARRGRAR